MICTENYSWDKYDAFVLVANTREEAKALIFERSDVQENAFDNLEDYEIYGEYTGKRKDAFILLDSFNAG